MNQFGRRNLSPGTRSILALKLEPILKAKADTKAEESRKEFHGNQHVSAVVPKSAPRQGGDRKSAIMSFGGLSLISLAVAIFLLALEVFSFKIGTYYKGKGARTAKAFRRKRDKRYAEFSGS